MFIFSTVYFFAHSSEFLILKILALRFSRPARAMFTNK